MSLDPLTDANFQLEQDILRCWNIVDDLRELVADLESGHMQQTEMAEALTAYQKVYAMRFERTFRNYETVCRGLHGLRAQVKDFESVQTTQSKSGKMGKSKKHEPVDNESEPC